MLNKAKIKKQKQNFYGPNCEAVGASCSPYSHTFQEGWAGSSPPGRSDAVKRYVMDIKDWGSLERFARQVRELQDLFWSVSNLGGIGNLC